MYTHAGKSAGGALASAVYLAGSLSSSAMAQGAPPNFAPNPSIGWYAYNRQFIPPPSVQRRNDRVRDGTALTYGI
jgi:hypothetical protein